MWVVSLAFADILLAITAIVTNVLHIYAYNFDNNSNLFWIVYIFAVSYFTFIGLNVDRTFAIKKPLQSNGQIGRSFYRKIFACWVLALLPALPYLWDTSLALCERHCHSCWIPVDNKPLMWWHTIVGCLAPMLIIFSAWVVIFHELRKTTIAVKRDHENRRVIYVMGIMTFAFIICTLPLTITRISSSILTPSTSMWLNLSYTSCFFNSVLNPILYLSVSTKAKRAFRALICCRSPMSSSPVLSGEFPVLSGESKQTSSSS
eukprot:GFUD01113516.1.p1 GENE.GFUD01113516.1~~GFUD01113516.1.p1  ORF type:complete len:274 (+),score=22.01 GFUD01113516.1:40-822(+)